MLFARNRLTVHYFVYCTLFIALAFMAPASMLMHRFKLAGLDVWRIGEKGAVVYC
jgi:hypothetical protein